MSDENITVQPDIQISPSEIKYLKLNDGFLHPLQDVIARERVNDIIKSLTENDSIKVENIDNVNNYYRITFDFKKLIKTE